MDARHYKVRDDKHIVIKQLILLGVNMAVKRRSWYMDSTNESEQVLAFSAK